MDFPGQEGGRKASVGRCLVDNSSTSLQQSRLFGKALLGLGSLGDPQEGRVIVSLVMSWRLHSHSLRRVRYPDSALSSCLLVFSS